MPIALIGAHGQLGSELFPLLGDDVVALGHDELDITDAVAVKKTLAELAPDVVINTAAYNLVDQAEDEPDIAYAVNALGPRNLAWACQEVDATMLHVSTDYVFGMDVTRNEPFSETVPPGPVSAYAISKLAGEYFVRGICEKYFVVRTCGLYGRAATRAKGNFVETMLKLGRERDTLSVVDDQRCTPSWTADVARVIAALIQTKKYGLYHATNSGSTTWYELAAEIFRLAEIDVKLEAITSAQFAAKARRPSYSVLNCHKLEATIGVSLPSWQEALANYLRE